MTRTTPVRLRNTTILLGSTLTIMAGSTIAPALPQIYAHFADVEQAELMVKLVLTLPALFIGLSSFLVGYLLDKVGRKPVLVFSLALYGLAGSSAFVVESLPAILFGRALLGVSIAGIMSGFTTVIGDYYQGKALNRFMGLQASFMSFGGVVFFIAGGWLADFGWQWPFLIYLVAWVLLPVLMYALPEPARYEKRPFEAGDQTLSITRVGQIYLLAFLGMAVFYLIPVQLAFYMRSLEEISAQRIGIVLALSTLVTAFASVNFVRVTARFSRQGVFCVSYGAMCLGFLCLYFATNSLFVLLSIAFIGLGFGLWIPAMNLWLMAETPARIRGKVVGGFTMCFFLGQFCSPVLSQPIIDRFGLAASFLAASALLLVLMLLFGLRGMRARPQRNPR